MKIKITTQTNFKDNKAIVRFEPNLSKTYGTDGIKFVIGDNGTVYRALKPKRSINLDLTDTNSWVPVDLVYNQHSFNEYLGVLKNGLTPAPQSTGMKLDIGEGTLHIYNGTKKGWDKYNYPAKNGVTFDYIKEDGTVESAGVTDIDPTKYYDNGTLTNVQGSNDATYQKIYTDKDGNIKVLRGSKAYTTLATAQRNYIMEKVPVIEGLYFLGGILVRKDCHNLESSRAVFVFSSKLTEASIGAGSAGAVKYKAPVADLNELKAIAAPEDGEARQDLSELPKIVIYVFNTNAPSGIPANDGTPGFWNKISAEGSLETIQIDSVDRNLEENKFYLVSTTAGNTTTLTLPVSSKDVTVAIKNVGDGDLKVVASNSGTIDGLADHYIVGTNTSFVYETIADDEWRVQANYTSSTSTADFNIKDSDNNDIAFADGSTTKTLTIVEGQIRLIAQLPLGKKIKSATGTGWKVLDRYTGELVIEPAIADTTLTLELEDVQYDFGAVGRIVFQVANPQMGIYAIDGSTIKDRLLNNYLQRFPIDGFVADADGETITLPDWRGRTLAGIGAYGIDTNGQLLDQSIQRHRHGYTVASDDYSTGSLGSGSFKHAHYGNANRITAEGGSDYTRPYTVGMQLCIVGTTLLKLDDNSKVATPVLISFNNGTVNGGETTGNTYEGVTPSRFIVDVPAGKMLDKDNITPSDNVIVVDAWTGVIDVQQTIGGGNVTVDLAFKDKPTDSFIRALEPFNVANGSWYLSQGGYFNNKDLPYYDKFIFMNGNENYSPYLTNDEGIDTKCLTIKKGYKHGVGGLGINLNNKSFLFSLWAKMNTNNNGTSEAYFLGNTDSGTASKALHIGWRNNTTFTVAFYSDDINITVPSEYEFANVKNKWIHIAVDFDRDSKLSRVFINGNKIGEDTHTDIYKSNFNIIGGARNASKVQGKFSQVRVLVVDDVLGLSDTDIQSVYSNELPFLKELN